MVIIVLVLVILIITACRTLWPHYWTLAQMNLYCTLSVFISSLTSWGCVQCHVWPTTASPMLGHTAHDKWSNGRSLPAAYTICRLVTMPRNLFWHTSRLVTHPVFLTSALEFETRQKHMANRPVDTISCTQVFFTSICIEVVSENCFHDYSIRIFIIRTKRFREDVSFCLVFYMSRIRGLLSWKMTSMVSLRSYIKILE